MTNKPDLKIVNQENEKERAYKKRASSQKAFYSQARVNTVAVERLKEALKASVVVDEEGKIVLKWTDEMIEALISDIEDPGPVRRG